MSRNFVAIRNADNGGPLAVYRETSRTELAPGQGALFSVPEGFFIAVSSEDGRSHNKHMKARLLVWQAATFMFAAALILSLAACTGTKSRADARAWAAYSKATGKIMQNGKEHP